MRRPGHTRPADQVVAPKETTLKAWPALMDLFGLVLRAKAKGLILRLVAAIVLTIVGALTGVIAPLYLGKAVNALSEGKSVVAPKRQS